MNALGRCVRVILLLVIGLVITACTSTHRWSPPATRPDLASADWLLLPDYKRKVSVHHEGTVDVGRPARISIPFEQAVRGPEGSTITLPYVVGAEFSLSYPRDSRFALAFRTPRGQTFQPAAPGQPHLDVVLDDVATRVTRRSASGSEVLTLTATEDELPGGEWIVFVEPIQGVGSFTLDGVLSFQDSDEIPRCWAEVSWFSVENVGSSGDVGGDWQLTLLVNGVREVEPPFGGEADIDHGKSHAIGINFPPLLVGFKKTQVMLRFFAEATEIDGADPDDRGAQPDSITADCPSPSRNVNIDVTVREIGTFSDGPNGTMRFKLAAVFDP